MGKDLWGIGLESGLSILGELLTGNTQFNQQRELYRERDRADMERLRLQLDERAAQFKAELQEARTARGIAAGTRLAEEKTATERSDYERARQNKLVARALNRQLGKAMLITMPSWLMARKRPGPTTAQDVLTAGAPFAAENPFAATR